LTVSFLEGEFWKVGLKIKGCGASLFFGFGRPFELKQTRVQKTQDCHSNILFDHFRIPARFGFDHPCLFSLSCVFLGMPKPLHPKMFLHRSKVLSDPEVYIPLRPIPEAGSTSWGRRLRYFFKEGIGMPFLRSRVPWWVLVDLVVLLEMAFAFVQTCAFEMGF